MPAASGASITSLDSLASVTRRAIRRLVLARMSALTTPAGRWVASTRCTPRERPRWAMPLHPVVLDVLGAGVEQQLLAALQLGRQRRQRPLRQVTVQVGDHADGVRQARAVLEGAAALVVDQHEG